MNSAAIPCKTQPAYQRRRPELTPCYQIIQEELSNFLAEREAEQRPVPQYVADEFESYLKCGIPQWGFLRLQCTSCKEEKIVAFSCKKRGFCPSCTGKRMMEAAAHLVDNVLPYAPYRQFVLTFPIPLRYWLNANKELFKKVHKIAISEIHRYYIRKARKKGIKEPKPGSISFLQRWGSDLRLNPHLHIICLDGVYSKVNENYQFNNLDKVENDDIEKLITAISGKVRKHLIRNGYLDKDGELVENPTKDDLFAENEVLDQAVIQSLRGKIAFGPNAGRYVTKIGSGFGFIEEIPLAKGRNCFSINGFSLHANTSTNTFQRDRLEKLIRYIARGPFSNKRLEILPDNRVKFELKTPYSDGTTHLLLSYSEFLEKIVAIIPPPKTHLVRWGGIFAPASPVRKHIVINPQISKGFQFEEELDKATKLKNYSWARMLARAFKVDVTKCEICDGDMKPLGAIRSKISIDRYLRHLGIDTDPPKLKPPRSQMTNFDFEQEIQSHPEELPTIIC